MQIKIIQWNISYKCRINEIVNFVYQKIDAHTIICLQEVTESHKKIIIESLNPTDYAYSLDYRKPGRFDKKNRRMGILTLAFGGKVENAKTVDRSVFPDRTLYTTILFKQIKVQILNFHSLTGVGYKKAKSSNFASIAEFLHDENNLDFFCCDANEPKVDSFEIEKLEFWNKGKPSVSLIFSSNKVHMLKDPVKSKRDQFDKLPYSYKTGKTFRRYDYIFKSEKWITKKITYLYDESIQASSDHAMVIGKFTKR